MSVMIETDQVLRLNHTLKAVQKIKPITLVPMQDQDVQPKKPELISVEPADLKRKARTPRILYVSQHWPHKARGASELRSFHVRRALQQIGKVDVVVLDVYGGGEDWVKSPDDEFELVEVAKVKPHCNRGLGQKLIWALSPYAHHTLGHAVGSDATRRVLRLIEDYDLVWFSKMRSASMFAQWAWPRSVLDIDDVPSTFETAVLQTSRGIRQRILTSIRHWTWQRREKLLGERFKTLVVCSEKDRRYLLNMGIKAPVHVAPNGFERPSREPVRTRISPPRIGFVAVFDYPPNLEGIQWFANQCWPLIKREVPDARLRLAGQLSNGPLKVSGPDVDWLGWVEDLGTEIDTWSAMAVPILTGAGTRVKIAQGFSRKCPIVSTSIGAYGYEAVNGREMYLADSAEAFAKGCVNAIRQPEQAAQMADRAWRQFLEKWTWEANRPRIWAAAEECLRLGAMT